VRAVGAAVGRTPRIVRLPATLARVALWTVGSLASLAGRATVLSADKADEFLAPAWTCRPDALTRDSGWRAATDLASGLSRTAAWYRAEGWL
jgi:nucleoside-diphosphate-sugar epimerase